MLSLEDFNSSGKDKKLALKDFNPPKQAGISAMNDATITNVAAHAAVLGTPAELSKVYSGITNELKSGVTSSTLNDLLSRQHAQDYSATLGTLNGILSDPTVSIEEKTAYTKGFANLTGEQLGSRSLTVEVARHAQIADSEADDNDETEWTRINTNYALDEVDAYNGWVQQHINTQAQLGTKDGFNSIVNILEIMVPFMEGAAVAKIRQELERDLVGKGGAVVQSLTLLGEAKQDVYKALAKMPIAQRRSVAESLIKYIKNSGGSVTVRPNDLIMMTELNDFLVSGSYTNESRILDNIFSLLDTTVLLSPVAKGIKGVFKGAGAARDAATARRAELAEESLVDEIEPEIDEVVGSTIYVNADGAASTNLNDVQLTRLEDDGSPIFVNPKGEASSSLEAVGPPSAEVLETAQTMITDRIIERFKLQTTKEAPSAEIAAMIDDIGAEAISNGLREDIAKKVKEILTPATAGDADIAKQITAGVKEVLTTRRIQTPKTFAPTATQLINQAFALSSATRRSVRTTVSHTSVSQTLKDVNPGRARANHRLVVADKSGKLAEITYGTTRTEAIANDILPEVAEQGGTVRNKVLMDESVPTPNKTLLDAQKSARGDSHFSKEEKIAMRNKAKSDFRDVVGLTPRTSMASIGSADTPTGVKFDMVYGPKDGGFKSPKHALDQAEWALRKYGVTRNEIELVARAPDGNYVPAKMADIREGSFLVRVKHDYKFSPADTLNWTLTSTNKFWRMFDSRVSWSSGKMGGLAQHFIPSTSIIDKMLINAASVASDRSAWITKKLIELASDYAKQYKGLNKRQKELVDAYIIEANNLSLPFNSLNLKARGLDNNAVDTLRSWKSVNDTLYYFENQDLNKTLRAKGYWKFVDHKSDTNLVVRPLSDRQLMMRSDVDKVKGLKAYDSGKDRIVDLNWQQIKELYENGGLIASTRGAIDHADDAFDLLIVRNSSDSSYVRRIRDEDNTLNYRDGHYTVRYDDPYFITKEFKKNGKTSTRAIATAGSFKDARAFLERLKATDEEGVYNLRGDTKKNTQVFDELEWSSLVSGGRTSQRVRGKRLENATGQQTDPEHIHIESPEESLVHSIGSMASRVSHRDFIDSAKARFMAQFDDVIPATEGQKLWPEDVRLIGTGDVTTASSRIKDAKATWRYIEAIDSGYVNLLDDASKVLFKTMSETAGRKGWGWLETAANKASQINPTAYARKKAFRFLLAANPLRQAPVQAMQALPVILATNPKFLLSGRLPAQFTLINYLNRGGDVDSFMKIMAKAATGLNVDEAKALAKHYEQSGFEAAVKANSLIRDDLKNLVDRSVYGRTRTALATPLNVAQRLGFEAGENALMRSVWLSEYDNLRKAKVKIDAEVLENLNARVRNLTLNMNKAGELPYNENMFSAAMQFFQAPHKAFAQIVMGHSGLSTMDRIKLGTSYVLTYGIGGGYLLDMISKVLPNDPKARELIEGGFFNLLTNAAISSLYGEEVETDFSASLRLLQFPDMFKFFNSLMDMQIAEALSASPSVGLVLGDNPRVTGFVKQALRMFTVPTDKTPEEMAQTGVAFLNIFSGASNFFKAKYIMENQKVINSSGTVVDPHANNVEALMKLAGFGTIDEMHQYAFNEKSYRATETYKEDITKVLTEVSRRLAVRGIANDESEYFLEMMAEAQRVFNNDPFYMREFQQQLLYRATRGEYDIYKTVLRLTGFVSSDDLRDLIISSPASKEQKDQMLTYVEAVKGGQ